MNILRGHRIKLPKHIAFITMKIDCFLANSADPDKMLHFAAFHLCLTACQSII